MNAQTGVQGVSLPTGESDGRAAIDNCGGAERKLALPAGPRHGLSSQESSGTPCGCSTNIAGGALCEERTGFPGSYCLAERQAEERAADERKDASAGLDPFYQVHVQVYSNDVPKGCKAFPTLREAREFSFARRREGFGTTLIATKDGKSVPLSTLPAEVLQ